MLWAKKFENSEGNYKKCSIKSMLLEEEKIIPFLPLLILAFVEIGFLF